MSLVAELVLNLIGYDTPQFWCLAQDYTYTLMSHQLTHGAYERSRASAPSIAVNVLEALFEAK
jgi:hypothetical protein